MNSRKGILILSLLFGFLIVVMFFRCPATVMQQARIENQSSNSGNLSTNQPIKMTAPPLIIAASMDDVDKIRELIKAGADVNERGAGHWHNTAIMEAAMAGRTNAVKELLNLGAEVNLRNDRGQTALMLAVAWGMDNNTNVLSILIAHGADVNADASGETPLHVALVSGDEHAETVKILRAAGAVTKP